MRNFLLNFISIFLLSLMLIHIASAATIEHAIVFGIRDNEGENTIETGIGQNYSFGVAEVIPDSYLGTTVSATNNNTGIVIDPLTNYAYQNRPGLFALETTYDFAQKNGYLTPWTITIKNDSESATRTSPDRSTAEKMEFVSFLSVTGPAMTPKISWGLPTTGPKVDRVKYELWNATTKQILSGQSSVPIGAAATSINLSGLQFGTDYAVRIILEERDDYGTVTRSSNWIQWEAKEGVAEATVLSMTTGSPVGVSQKVNTPSETFNIEFDYRFTTETGFLDVYLNNILVGSRLESSSIIQDDFFHAVFEIEEASLLNLSDVSLLFQLDGPSGSNILIDNIIFPGLLNGNFEQELSMWTSEGPGIVSTTNIPEPTTITLFGFGILAFAAVSRKKLKAD